MKFVESKKQKNNRGVALVSVLIVITLIGLLGSSILNLSYLAYQRKLVEKRNTENFYAAESVIDTVEAVLQNLATTALASASDGTAEFAETAFKSIVGTGSTDGAATSDQVAAVQQMLYDEIIDLGLTDSTGTSIEDAISTNGGEFSISGIVVESDCLRIEGVHVVYVNDEGYKSDITTDIVINAPVYANEISVPVGSYSMFAGNGGRISASTGTSAEWQTNDGGKRAMNNMLYMHQEGNAYFGYSTSDVHTALVVGASASDTTASKRGMDVASFGGTNIVFNGDVVVANGNTLVFTGGDGSEQANIQVNGYIVLKEGATLLLASNCNLVCKGIVSDIEYNADGSVTVTPYTGTGEESTISQFYPFAETSIITSTSIYQNKFKSGVASTDVAEILSTLTLGDSYADKSSDSSSKWYLDDRFVDVSKGTAGAGVYILNSTQSTAEATSGQWTDRAEDTYSLIECDVTYSEGVRSWSFKDATTGVYSTNIICSETDTKLNQEEDVVYTYNGTEYTYDAEFASIVNVAALLKCTQQFSQIKYVDGYSLEDDSTYDSDITWGDIEDMYVTQNTGISSIYNWDTPTKDTNGNITANSLLSLYENTTFYIPNVVTTWTSTTSGTTTTYTASVGDVSTFLKDFPFSDYSFTANGVTYYTATGQGDGYGYVGVGNAGQTIDASGTNAMLFYLTNETITVHVGDYFAGICMSASEVIYSENSGVTRGISLLELAEQLTDNGLEDEDNPVRKYLVKVGAAVAYKALSETSFNGYSDAFWPFLMVDNILNGGVSRFWETGTGSPANPDSQQDNYDMKFVITENWDKDKEAETTTAATE